MLVAASVCPHPPLLVPSVGVGAAAELDELRAACRDAVAAIFDCDADVTYVVGVDSTPHARSMRPWGADERIDVPEPLPLSLLIGGWLTAGRVRSFVAVGDDLDASECAALGRELVESAERVALLVMGDGSARHSEKAPGYVDERAAGFDEGVATALSAADVDFLLRLDPALARALLVAGRAPWQVLAGAAEGRPPPQVRGGWQGAPYGVGYHLFTWTWQEIA